MKSRIKRAVWITLVTVILTNCTKNTTSLPEDVAQNIQKRIEYGINGAIAIGIVDENGTRYYNFGTRDSSGSQVNEHTIFEIGSISKTFTATLLADQVLKGNLNLEDPINQFLPDSVKVPVLGTREITLGNLSDHTSGLPPMPANFTPANPSNPFADFTVQQLYEFISTYTPIREVGSEGEYSNLAAGLLGHILALQAGKSYEEILADVITTPLGMGETKITLDEIMKKNLAEGRDDFGRSAKNWDIPTLPGAGAIRSSTSDMIKYLSSHLSYTESHLRSSFDLTYQKRHEILKYPREGQIGVGLGWLFFPSSNNEIFWHTGGTGGYKTFTGFDRTSGKGVVVLSTGSRPTEIGLYLLDTAKSLNEVKRVLANDLRKEIDLNGVNSANKYFEDNVINNLNEYDYNEDRINVLGYAYLSNNNLDASLAILKINVRLFPEAWNTYDSYGQVLKEKGLLEESLKNYSKSVELNPENQYGLKIIAELERELGINKN